MDNEFEGKVKQIIEHVSSEISDDALESIIKAQRKFSNGGRLYLKNATVDVRTTERNQYGTRHVATMTDQEQCLESSGKNKTEHTSTEKPAERGSKKRTAEQRKEIQLNNKMYKPGECMKHMTVELHPSLLSAWYAADVAREVSATGARVRAAPSLYSPELVLWTRGVGERLAAEGGLVRLSPVEQCARALYVTTAEELAELVAGRGLARTMGHVAQLTGCQLTLVVFGARDYFKPSGRKKSSNHRQLRMTEVELEMALTDLLVSRGCDAVKVDTPNELALTLVHFTKAIAEAPYKNAKRQCDERAQFYMRGDNKNCVTVNKNGAGAGQLWQQMLAVLPMSSLERARALCGRYPSPRRLMQELQSPGGVETVADIGVPRSAVPGSLARRTGTEFARKLAILFTADDGDALVQ